MAHAVENMFSVRETPWHKLGVILDAPPTSAEAIRAAGLDWSVEKAPLFLADGRPVESFASVRSSDRAILGHGGMGKRYTLLQNRDAFAFFDPFLDAAQATLETAGSLHGGAVVWILARLGRSDSIIVPRADDRVAKYLLLSNAHDGSASVKVGFTPTRVVCANTLAMAHDAKDKGNALLSIRHTSSVVGTLDMVRDAVNVADAKFEATAEQYRALASRQINAKQLERYVAFVFGAPAPKVADPVDDLIPARFLGRGSAVKESRTEANVRIRKEAIEAIFTKGRGNDLPGVKGTWWAAYNAITEYLSHERPRSTAESRLDSLAFGGDAAEKNSRALGGALAALNA